MTRYPRLLTAASVALVLAGCAAPRIDGQWSDPAFADRTLRDRTVLVACRAPDTTLARLCEDRLADALRERGARPVRAATPVEAAGGHEAVARAAREARADAAVAASVTVAAVAPQSLGGPSIGIGLGGGFGGGRGGIGFGGLGVSVPLGGVRPQSAFGASTAVLDVASAREIWSVRATTPMGEQASVQVAELVRVSVDAMRSAGLFEPR
jgi:hypothetical protein